jgi:hypothetical protein
MAAQTYDLEALLAAFADGPRQLRAALSGLAEADLDAALSPDTWTIRQIVHHVVDGDDLWKTCLKAALGETQRRFELQWYWDHPQEWWVETWDYAGRPVEPSLAFFEAGRRHVVQLLRQVPGACERCIVVQWPGGEEQQVSIGWIVEMQTRHVVGHVDDIRRIRQARGLDS